MCVAYLFRSVMITQDFYICIKVTILLMWIFGKINFITESQAHFECVLMRARERIRTHDTLYVS